MVRILSNGEIVADSDEGAQGDSSPSGSQRPRQGFVQHDDTPEQQQQQQYAGGASMFDSLSQRLSQAGVPRWNLGPYTVEPIVSLGFLVALLLMGFRGLLFAVVLFFVAKYSQQSMGGQGQQQGRFSRGPDAPRGPQRSSRGDGSGRGGWGGGTRLGRD